jgi:aspartate/methionine/tyrosine aminotransferase
MSDLNSMGRDELQSELHSLNARYEEFVGRKLKLNIERGRPGADQLELSMKMLEFPGSGDSCKTADGTDCRNYGVIDGIPEAKALFAQMLEVSPREIIIGGNSSLSMMYDSIARAVMFGVIDGDGPWSRLPKVRFLCPSPGYDRHFAITELFGIEMITIDMKPDGPDMDAVERLASEDGSIKGIWCTPKYSNPDGITYSDEVVDRLAAMKTRAPDFRIFWDNAYTVHHLTDKPDRLKNIMEACKAAGNPNRPFIFASTSKITFPGAGIAMMGASEANIAQIKKHLAIRTIGPDKLNQLRHVHFLKDMQGIEDHMKKHAAMLRPKFDMVLSILEEELGGRNIAWWNKPRGGYFISLNVLPGCASDVYKLITGAGIAMTPVGATFPYGRDPQDRNLRIAPTSPPLAEVKTATEVLCTCVRIASIKKFLGMI